MPIIKYGYQVGSKRKTQKMSWEKTERTSEVKDHDRNSRKASPSGVWLEVPLRCQVICVMGSSKRHRMMEDLWLYEASVSFPCQNKPGWVSACAVPSKCSKLMYNLMCYGVGER